MARIQREGKPGQRLVDLSFGLYCKKQQEAKRHLFHGFLPVRVVLLYCSILNRSGPDYVVFS